MKQENEFIAAKCKTIYLILLLYIGKLFFDKFENYSESLNGTILSDITQISTTQKKEVKPIRANHKSSSKINIQNLVIHKKVQIGKQVSKVRINSISNTSPDKHNKSFNTIHATKEKNQPISNTRKTPTKIRINSKVKNNLNSSYINNNASRVITTTNTTTNHHFAKSILFGKSHNKLKIKKNNSINDIRKLSIIDIPSINTPSNTQIGKNAFYNQKRKKNSIFDFLYQKDQKLLLILAKSK